jgi:hypothetical protein
MKEFKFDKPHTIEEYNSNNARGFGGTRGRKYIFSPTLYLIIGWAGTRHMGEFPHMTLRSSEGLELDFSGHASKDVKKVNNRINEILDEPKSTGGELVLPLEGGGAKALLSGA